MPHRISELVLIVAAIFCFGESYGQGAFDSACYFPRMGNPNELDTIYGGQPNQGLGANLKHLPPLHGQTYDRLAMQGLQDNAQFLSSIQTGPTFNLHSLNLITKYPYVFKHWPHFVTGHFHSQKFTDILTYNDNGGDVRIYWADQNNDYDSGRYTLILPFDNRHMSYPYVARLTSDTVEDIVMSINFLNLQQKWPDTSYIALVKGGQHLYDQGRTALWDDTAYWGHSPYGPNKDTLDRFPSQGDWRGIGRDDLITIDNWGNFFYYRNDPPFDLHRLAKSMRFDTLLVAAEWSLYKGHFNGLGGGNSMRVFPKTPSDRSMDLIAPLPIELASDTGLSNGICIFKGGPDFGSKRLSYDSPDYFLHSPAYYSGDFVNDVWPGDILDCGDLTGTGNPVLAIRGGYFTYGFTSFYVLGKALDDKIDAFFSQNGGGYGGADTIHVSNGGKTTFIMGAPAYQSPEDQKDGIFQKGSLQVLYGAEKIPVRLNPQFADAPQRNLDESPSHIIAYPNPCSGHTVLTFDNCSASKMKIQVVSTSGVEVLQDETPAVGGLQQYAVDLSTIPAGEYIVNLSCPLPGWSSSVKVIKQGAAVKPWTFDLKKMVGR
ncbi:MAG: T9SS type A sorting domain-containing protein [Bacteroidota bacterium]|nr:T9SS type A sorting domain-containing protein [Bacteroidota bacterium]